MPDISPSSLPQPFIAPGLVTQFYRGDKTWQFLNKAAVGLGDVDNTSDADKPVSTAAMTLAYGAQGRTRSPGCLVRKTDTLALTSSTSTYTALDFTGHWAGGNQDSTVWGVGEPSKFYAPVTGRYNVAAQVAYTGHATGYRTLQIRVSGSSALCFMEGPANTAKSWNVVGAGLTDVYLTAGQYLEALFLQSSGTTLSVGQVAGVPTSFSMSYIGPA